jgi:hypothetical protein
MTNHKPAATLEEISAWIHSAALADTWRVGHQLGAAPPLLPEACDIHFTQMQAALDRAARKTFVRAAKPMRRLLRNQGAVNDSVIEAIYHLAMQNQEMREQLHELRAQVASLQTERLRGMANANGAAAGRATRDKLAGGPR